MRKPVVRLQVEELESRTVLSTAGVSLPRVAAVAGVSPSAAATTYALVLRNLAAGHSARVDQQTSETLAVSATDARGRVVKSEQAATALAVGYKETVLSWPAGSPQPTSLRRRYDLAQSRTGSAPVTTYPFQGKMVLIDKLADGYHFRIKSGELTGAAAGPLADEFNRANPQTDYARVFLPPGRVAVGQSWAVNPTPLVQDAARQGLALFGPGASGTGTLARVYRQGGHRFGTLVFLLNLPIASLPLGQFGNVPAAAGSAAVVRLTVDACIDGGVSTLSGHLDLALSARATISTVNGPLVVTLASHYTNNQTLKELPPGA